MSSAIAVAGPSPEARVNQETGPWAQASPPVLTLAHTKLFVPGLPSDLVTRQGLLRRLGPDDRSPVTFVCAPAGYGKTTLVSEWVASGAMSAVWLSLDGYDSEPATFLNALVAAVRTAHPGWGDEIVGLLRSPQPAPRASFVEVLIDAFQNIGNELTLVLDDYHLIDDPEIHLLFAELLLRLPPNLMVVVMARGLPPELPAQQLRERGQLTEINAEDLLFTMAEARAFWRVAAPDANDESLVQFHDATEGWIAGLRLLALSSQMHAPGPRSLPRCHQGVEEFLLEQVFDAQRYEMREFLLVTVVVDRVHAGLCDGLVANLGLQSSGAELLQRALRRNLFLVPLDGEGVWYRYHHLLRDALRRRLHATKTPDEIRALHGCASGWFEEHGYLTEAIGQAIEGGDELRAAILIEQNTDISLEEERWTLLDEWMTLLPERLVRARPALLLSQAWCLYFRRRYEALPALANAAEMLLDAGAPAWRTEKSLRGELSVLRALIADLHAEPKLEVEHALRAFECLPPSRVRLRGTAATYYAVGLKDVAGPAAALQWLEDESSKPVPAIPVYRMRLLQALVWIYFTTGDLPAAEHVAREMVELGLSAGLFQGLSWAYRNLALISYEWNQPEAARGHALSLLAMGANAHTGALGDGGFLLAFSQLALGDHEEARRTLAGMADFARKTRDTACGEQVRIAQARLSHLQGDREAALDWLRSTADEEPGPSARPYVFADRAVTRAQILLNGPQPDRDRAESAVTRLLGAAGAPKNRRREVTLLCLQAMAYQSRGVPSRALATMERAIELAQPGRLIRTFVDLGPGLVPLLREAAARGKARSYVSEILAAFGEPVKAPRSTQTRPAAAANDTLYEPLTPRELDVLELLARRLTNKEIAAVLSISWATVTKHTVSVYQKLGVQGRRAAVARGYALDLLSQR